MRISKPPEERRREILEASKELFHQNGFAKTTIGDIAAHIGIAKGLFYYYFRNKDEVMAAIIDDYTLQVSQAIRAIAAEEADYREKLERIVFAVIDFSCEAKNIFSDIALKDHSLLHQSVLEHAVQKMVEVVDEVVDAGVRDGIIHSKHPHTMARMMLYGLGMMDFSQMERTDVLEIVAQELGIQ